MAAGTALIVTAHPDDEAMFFGPTIQRLQREGTSIHVLSLSTGNAEGLGCVRRDELLRACEVLGVPHENVTIKDVKGLQDGTFTQWDERLVAQIVINTTQAVSPTTIITFDAHGVSGHANHRAVHRGLLHLMRDTCTSPSDSGRPSFQVWQLVSTGTLRKFLGSLDIPLSQFEAAGSSNQLVCHVATSPLRIVRAMAQHRSQWVWFRKLFMAFSRYTYVNTLQRIDI